MSSSFLCQVIPVYVIHTQDIISAGLYYEHRNLLQAKLQLRGRRGISRSQISDREWFLSTVDQRSVKPHKRMT